MSALGRPALPIAHIITGGGQHGAPGPAEPH
jgi:hypothetical protein